MFEDWSVDVDQAGDDDESAAQTPVSQSKLLPVDLRLIDVLASHQGRAGICPGVPRLAEALRVSESTVHRSLRRLEGAGLVERVAVFERDDDPEWQRRGHRPSHPRRQTSNTYRLLVTPHPGVTEQANVPAQTPVSPESVTPHEGKEVVQPVSEGGVGEAPRARDSWTAAATALAELTGRDPLDVGRQHPLERLDYDPSRAEILAALEAGLGPVEVLAEWPNDQLPPRSVRRWRTVEESPRRPRRRKPKGKP